MNPTEPTTAHPVPDQPAHHDTESVDTSRTVVYFLQTQQPDGSWADSSSVVDTPSQAQERLARRKEQVPDVAHRIARHTTTSVLDTYDPAASRCGRALSTGQPCPDHPAAPDGLRDRIAAAARTVRLRLGPNALRVVRSGEPIILSGGEADALADAVLAVLPAPAADVEQLRERHKASLRRADEINNRLMEEVQRYAAGTERPVLWSVYNDMHDRALRSEAEAKHLRARVAELTGTLGEVLDTFSPMREVYGGPIAYYDGSADITPTQYDGWRAALAGRAADRTADPS